MKDKKFKFVYKTTNTINNKIYIGQHKTNYIEDGYLGSGSVLLKAIDKHGREKFRREILKFCKSQEELNLIETQMISRHDSTNKRVGYNISPVAVNNYKSSAGIERISKARKGIKLSNETKRKMAKPKSETAINNMIIARRERILREGKRVWYHNKHTKESKQIIVGESIPNGWVKGRGKIKKQRKKYKLPEHSRKNVEAANKCIEKRKKISNSLKGHIVSEETRQKIRESLAKTRELKKMVTTL